MQQLQQSIWFIKEGFKNMINYYKRNGLNSFQWTYVPNYIARLMIYVLIYRLFCTIEMCIRNKKIKAFDILYIILILFNQKLILNTNGFGLISWKLFGQLAVDIGLFIVLQIMYKEKIVSKAKVKNTSEKEV